MKAGLVFLILLLLIAVGCFEGGGAPVRPSPLAQAPTLAVDAPVSPAARAIPTQPTAPRPTVATRPPPSPTPGPTAARLLVWVRQDTALVNPENQALGWDYGQDPRRKQSFVEWQVAPDSFTSRQRYQEDENIWYDNVVMRVTFERPPLVLNPSLRYELRATFTHSSGALNVGYEGLGENFFWYTDRGTIEPPETFSYVPFAPNFDGTNAKTWMLSVPPPAQPGDTFELAAVMRNWPPGKVIWKYTAEYH